MRYKKVAVVITGGNINHRKGFMNACLSRAVHLAKVADYQVDIYVINEIYRKFGILPLLHKEKYPDRATIDGYPVRMLWYAEFYAERYYRRLLNGYYSRHKKRLTDPEYLDKYVSTFKDYDLLCVHSSFGGYLARRVKAKYGIPYCITWHGSDTHTNPFQDEKIFHLNVVAMQDAECNFYVSKALMALSDRMTTDAKKVVLYNGAEDSFYRYSDEGRARLRTAYGLDKQKVVAFVGNLYPIKNADLLPEIFHNVRDGYDGDLVFWIIGDGDRRKTLELKMNALNIPCKFWGNRSVSEMPAFMNCVDILVLPSRNEGMSLVTIEAISCGANAVGSDAGGIPEVIGNDYCVALGDGFVSRFAAKVVEVLNNPRAQVLDPAISWERSAILENDMYKDILLKNDV